MATSAGTIPINATFNGAQLEKDVLSALNRIQSKSSLNLNTRNFTQPLGKITGLANEFNKSLEASNARVVAFGASAGLIFAVQKSFTALVATTIEVEKSLTDINIVLNTSSKGIKQFGDQLFDVARNTGAAFKDVAGAATEFSRQGLGLEETLKRTRDALILTRLSGLDVVSSTEALTAAVNSFTKEALTTTDVVNKLAAVDAKFAVSSRDLSEALQRVGSSASEAGVSFDELLGIVTSVQQTTARGGAVIGNALKTIFTRIERPQVISDLRDFGIAVTDISGNALPTIKIIENLAQSFQNLNPVVKSQVAELVGGVYQINILKAALADVSKQNSAFAEATRTSSKAADEAIIKNDALNKSLSALINTTSVNFVQFATKIGEVSVAPGIRKVLGLLNDGLESYNQKDSEGVGEKIATGLLKGITDFVTGPGLGLGALAVGKLIANFASFAGDATRNILGLNTLGRQQAVVQGEIGKILSNNPQLIQQIIAGTKTRLQVEREIKQILIEQAAISEKIKTSSADIGARFLASGLGVSTSGAITGRRSSGGYIPAKQQAAEMVGAMQGGYAPGKVVAAPKSIGGVMNTAETVKYVPGFAQPYILPPQGSSAARNLTSKSMAKNGINPYQARGFVPNFAPRSLDNNGRYADSDYWYGSGLNAPVPLSQIQTGTAASWSPDKGFFRTDGKNFTANDLNTFIRRGATYGEIRKSLQKIPDSFFEDDPRYKAGTSKEQLIREFRPGSKTSTVESVKEEVKRVFEPFTPPASMLIWDLERKDNDQDEVVDLEKLTKDKKQAGRSYKIKIRALSGNALNEERFGLIDRTSKFARDITKKLASGIPGAKSDYSDAEVDDYFNKTGKNYNVLAGTIFEAGTNLAASYVRDRAFRGSMGRSGSGGDFDIMGGSNLSNVQKFFPGFTDLYGDYKLNNSYDAIREFIAKVEKEFPIEISNHFAKQESKIAGITTSAGGFIPNFAPKPFNFRFSNLGEKTAQISPKLRDWLADKYFDPEMASPEMLERLASLNRDSGAFFATLENPNAVAGIPVRGQQGFVSRQNRGARAGALLNALRTRLPNFVPGSLPTLASGFVPNFLKVPKIKSFKTGEGERVLGPAPIVNRQTKEEFVKKVLEGKQAKSYLRYSRKDDSIDVDFVRSSRRGDGGFLWDRAGSIAKRLGLPLTTSAFLPQKENLKKYDAETGSFEEVLATGFPQLKWSQRGKALRTKLNLYNDYSEYPIESKDTFSEAKNILNNIYKYDAPALKDSILRENTYIQDIISYFAKGFIPNFNPIQEAIGREMAAGYSSSQVRLGQSNKLRTSFNPMGLGVYNSEEGSLNNGIGLAEKAGINPKTKGMSARGHVPNFAEFGGLDLFAVTSSLAALAFSARDFNNTLKELNTGTKQVIDDNTKAASASADSIKKANEDLDKILKDQAKESRKLNKEVSDYVKKTFSNVSSTTLKVKPGLGAVPMKAGGLAAAPADEIAKLEELRKKKIEAAKKRKEIEEKAKADAQKIIEENKKIQEESESNIKSAKAGRLGAMVSRLGPSLGIVGSTLANVGSQFVPVENKKTQAVFSGAGDVLSLAGTGAAFGPVGAAAGAALGIALGFKKFVDAKAEQAIDKINESLEKTKEKISAFSGAAQNYSTSLEGLQNALNDPKTKPEALLKFQNNLTDALSSIPEEFRDKVLKAGTDITKVAEAIAGVNKELNDVQKNIEKQLTISNLIRSESGMFSGSSVSEKNQKSLNALLASSLSPEAFGKNFKGPNAAQDVNDFFDNLKKQSITTEPIFVSDEGGSSYVGDAPVVNQRALKDVKTQLVSKAGLPEVLESVFDSIFEKFNPAAVESIIDAFKKQGLAIIDSSKRSKILTEILDDNTKRTLEFNESLKQLNGIYNTTNLLISNQIDIEKNRAKTIREINKIQAEGNISIQRARVKGLLDASSPFISEGTKNDIQAQLDINEINSRQNSKIQEASNKVLDSFSDIITKRAEEARTTIGSAIETARDEKAITKERSIFQAQIQKLTPLISQSIKRVTEGGDIEEVRKDLEREIRTAEKAFKPEQQELLIQSLNSSFSDFQNTLAEIKAQGDVDVQIQEAQREYQKQSLALNQRLSFAGGAQALGSTGRAGVSDLFDNVSDLISELRQTNSIGNAAQRGSGAFKLLDILTNQLQLNRAIQSPSGFKNAQSFNAQVSSDLRPIAATAIAGRVQQIRESVDLARRVTEIQTGKSTAGTALGAAFDQAKEGAVRTALDQVASQFKLENMGSYLDLLQQEAQYLNELTNYQNEILARTLPKSLNDNFNTVIRTEVGDKLENLTINLGKVVNRLSSETQKNTLDIEQRNLLPTNVGPKERQEILDKVLKAGPLADEGKVVTKTSLFTEKGQANIRAEREKEISALQDYFESFSILKVVGDKSLYGKIADMVTGDSSIRAERDDYGNIVGGVNYGPRYRGNRSFEDRAFRDQAIELQETFGASDEAIEKNKKRLAQLINSRSLPFSGIATQTIDYTGTYKELADKINKEYQTSMAGEDLKSIVAKEEQKKKIASNEIDFAKKQLKLSQYGPFRDGYKFPPEAQFNLQPPQPTDTLKRTRLNVQRLSELSESRYDNEELVAINTEVEKLLNKKQRSAEEEERLLKLQVEIRNKTLEIQNKINEDQFRLYYKTVYGEKFFKDEKAVQANALIESEAREGRVAVGAITQKNTEYNRADFARDTGQLIDTFQTDFKSGIASAFGEAIKGTKTLKDAFRDMFQGILNRMLDKSLEMGVDALFAFGKAYAQSRKDGGLIKGYNSGGMVTGGSGMKDDVPAMMSGGEYVIKKSSVNKYGANYLRALNGGLVPRYATGGFSIGPLQNEFLYNDPERPTSGEFAVDSRLSAMALTDENNPQNRLRQDRYEKLDQYLQDRAQYEKDKQQAIKNYKNQVNSTFYSGLASAAIQLGAAGLTIGASNMSNKTGMPNRTQIAQAKKAGVTINSSGIPNMATGGYIHRFAGGGSTGKDDIPALLMGGEYVMNKKAVDMYGKDFMGQLNAGTLPKYASGGLVGTSYTAQGNPQTSVEELVTALNTLNENLSKDGAVTQAESGKISAAGATQESGMSVVNNISINVAQGGEVASEANSTTQQGKTNTQNSQNNIQNNAKLGELLRSKVVEVLVEQKRPGGLLYASR